MLESNLDKLYKLLETVYEDLDKTKDLISKLQLEARKEALKDVPGVEGVFDGKFLITDSNEKIEVPANYAAKSRIVYGDRLKMYEEDGKKMFKQVEKVSRKKVFAIVSKKEGKFFALTEYGDHELSPIAIEFNNIKVGEKIQVILPENNTKSPFATLDKSLDQEEGSAKSAEVKTVKETKQKEPETTEKKTTETQEFVMDLTNKVSEPVTLDITPKVEEPKEIIKKPEAPVEKKPVDEKKELKPFVLDEDDLR